jgi:uncharacterized protein (DUF433 family)
MPANRYTYPMTAPTEVNIGTLIERRPGVYGGRPVLKGTRFPVLQIGALVQDGLDAAAIHHQYPHLDPVLIHAGITYYLANREQIDRELEEEAREYEEAARTSPTESPYARRP